MSSYFAAALTDLLAGRSQRDIAALSGIGQSTLSLYASGSRGISVEALGELIKAFPDRREQLSLVRAHLLDEIPADVFLEIGITIGQAPLVSEEQDSYDKDLDGAIQMLRVKAKDPEVRKVIIDLHRILK